ncbi:MAG: HAMP domain-containing histidine kinase [Thiobacillus sp.]|nr:HAMP domain-containing histidine kinase [Thiobacillus sp.]
MSGGFGVEYAADAAHQLRTPIAGIRAQAETALAGGDCPHALTKIAEAARNMGELVSKLLMLAKVDAAETALRLTPLDGVAVARAGTRDWVPRALECSVEIGFDDKGGDAAMLGDALLLREMLGNLIDNALRYGATRISVAVAGNEQGVLWCVEDDGPGIPEAERTAVLAPFHRLGASAGGAGLGLAIVERIARLHGARLRLSAGANGVGLAVTVQFPKPDA